MDARSSQTRVVPAGVAVAVAWLAVDLVLAWPLPAAGGPSLALALVALALIAAGIGLLATVFAALAALVERLSRAVPARRVRLAFAASPYAALAVAVLLPTSRQLVGGEWISRQSWAGALGLAAVVLGALAVGVAAAVAIGASRASRRGRLAPLALICAVVLVAADQRVLPQYPALHLVFAAGFVLAVGGGAALLADLVPRRRGMGLTWAGACAGLSAVVLVATGGLPGEDVVRREILLDRAPLTARVLRFFVAPSAALRPEDAPPELLALLRRPSAMDRGELDRLLPARRSHDIVVITIDTLRPDHLSFYDDRLPTSPNIDRFAASALAFDVAYSTFPSSFLGITSTFTGRYPTATAAWRAEARGEPALAADPTLAERLAAAGFETAAVTSFPATFLDAHGRFFTSGFQSFENHDPDRGGRALDGVVERAIERLEGARTRPLFLWVHAFDPHLPYSPPSPEFGTAPRDLYDAEIAHTDRELGRLLARLDEPERRDRTVIALHSDHGEEFGEHGGTGHHSSLFEEQIRVPLFLRVPGLAPRRLAKVASLVDLTPTLLELADVAPPPGVQGRSLVARLVAPRLAPRGDREPGVAFFQFRHPRHGFGHLDGLRDGPLKLIHDLRADRYELYDLRVDPRETVNLALADHPALARLRGWMRAYQVLAGGGERRATDAELMATLAASTPARRDAVRELGLRRAEGAVPELIARLEDPDGTTRRLAAVSLALIGDRRAVAPLLRLADRTELADVAAGLATAVLVGEGVDDERLRGIFTTADAGSRALVALALASRGDASLRTLCAHLLHEVDLDPLLQVLIIATFGRARLVAALPALYGRALFSFPRLELAHAVLEAAVRFEPLDAAPVLRHFAVADDRSLRERARELLVEGGRAPWIRAAEEAEPWLREARRIAVFADGVPYVTELHRRAFEHLGAVGVLDWGIALEHWYYLAGVGRSAAGAEHLRAWLEAAPAVPAARARVERLLALAESRTRSVQGRFELVTTEETWDRSTGRTRIVVRIALDEASSGLIGGPGDLVEYLATQRIDEQGVTHDDPLFTPLPVDGILPGEVALFDVPAETDRLPLGTGMIGCAVTRTGEVVLAPFVVTRPVVDER